jgi:hypothetical protein
MVEIKKNLEKDAESSESCKTATIDFLLTAALAAADTLISKSSKRRSTFSDEFCSKETLKRSNSEERLFSRTNNSESRSAVKRLPQPEGPTIKP